MTKTSVRIDAVPADIRTEHLPNTSEDRYLCVNAFSAKRTVNFETYLPLSIL